ncbi:MAG TPA: DUF1285 domain-containing protein [Alphaproteobacteria bacterium]
MIRPPFREPDVDPAELAQHLDAPGGAGVADSLHPDASACGHFGIRIARDGTWFYHGSPITRKPLVKLFAKVLRRESDGSYWLVTPVERGRIDVEDVPFTAVELRVEGEGRDQRLIFRTNLDDEIVAGPAHPIRVEENPETREPAPYIRVRDGLEARILRPVFYELVQLGVDAALDGRHVLGVWSDRQFFRLGSLS